MLNLRFPIRAISKSNEKIFNRQGRPFTSRRFKDFERSLQVSFLAQKPSDFKLLIGPIYVSILCRFKDKRKPDTPNLPKSITDAFNGIIWEDDRQISELKIQAILTDYDEISMTVYEL